LDCCCSIDLASPSQERLPNGDRRVTVTYERDPRLLAIFMKSLKQSEGRRRGGLLLTPEEELQRQHRKKERRRLQEQARPAVPSPLPHPPPSCPIPLLRGGEAHHFCVTGGRKQTCHSSRGSLPPAVLPSLSSFSSPLHTRWLLLLMTLAHCLPRCRCFRFGSSNPPPGVHGRSSREVTDNRDRGRPGQGAEGVFDVQEIGRRS